MFECILNSTSQNYPLSISFFLLMSLCHFFFLSLTHLIHSHTKTYKTSFKLVANNIKFT